MKYFKNLLVILLLVSSIPAYSVHSLATPAPQSLDQMVQHVTINQFLAIDLDHLENKGVKIGWLKKSAFKYAQHQLAKKVRKGKLDGTSLLNKSSAGAKGSHPNRNGRMSFASGVLSLLFLFLGPLGWLSLPLAILGFILGIRGAKRDQNKTFAVIGLVLNILVILLFALAITIFTTFF